MHAWRAMLSFPPAVRIELGSQHVDLRRSLDRLADQARKHLQGDPLSCHIFVSCNTRSDRVELLHLDEDDYVIVCRRSWLEGGKRSVAGQFLALALRREL
jgi:hypothetical protein